MAAAPAGGAIAVIANLGQQRHLGSALAVATTACVTGGLGLFLVSGVLRGYRGAIAVARFGYGFVATIGLLTVATSLVGHPGLAVSGAFCTVAALVSSFILDECRPWLVARRLHSPWERGPALLLLCAVAACAVLGGLSTTVSTCTTHTTTTSIGTTTVTSCR